eukprot:CAMPEP_0170179618 /NCGR_PEP_ID=MMETSP0040_2-20121228/18579_1 /TAXON_ID=641309 /ORGANISM="Lotharella oceanica, Strain CCMP622" /LENGTH=366 /DNA_ID=CAMNT_0010423835 /DNA_START=51 /DNA_END=1151 /DNA_ORIENTATION=+
MAAAAGGGAASAAGVKPSLDTLAETDKDGRLVRSPSLFRNQISDEPDARFKPATGRYHLYVSYGCPWANRCLAALNLKRLRKAIGVSVVHPTWQLTSPETDEHKGWTFRNPGDPPLVPPSGYGEIEVDGLVPDDVNKAKTIRYLYELAAANEQKLGHGNGDPGKKFSVPVLWDKEEGVIVNNESEDILRLFNAKFNDFSEPGPATPDLYPDHLVSQIQKVNSWVYDHINNGVYKCGFAKSQKAYDEAIESLYIHLDKAEDILSRQRYLCGSTMTEADIRLFMTLVRFDEVYAVYFKCNKKLISQYPNLLNYCRDLYQTPGIGESINMDHIKKHYYTSHPILNHYAIVPAGPNVIEDLKKPHNRAGM